MRSSVILVIAVACGCGSGSGAAASGDAGDDTSVGPLPDASGEVGDATAFEDSTAPRDARGDVADADTDAGGRDAGEASSGCCDVGRDCSENSECCSGTCLWTGSGGQCVSTCTSNAQCASGCCINGSCAPEADWCQSTFTCWPYGHGCASDPTGCCPGTDCADIGVNTQILVCTIPCSTGSDCTSGCCVPFQVGGTFCDRGSACGVPPGSCSVVIPKPDAGTDASAGDAEPDSPGSPCDAGALFCGGQCVPNDAANCGTCGHACLCGPCVGGVCQPVTLASGQTNADAIAVDGTSVYWVNDTGNGSVAKVPIAGGAVTTLASSQYVPQGIAVDPVNVYWTVAPFGANDSNVLSIPLNGGALSTLAYGSGSPHGIAVRSGAVYWTDYHYEEVSMVPVGGGNPTVIASSLVNPWQLALDATSVYWSDTGSCSFCNDGTLLKAPASGGAVTTLASGLTTPSSGGIAVDATSAYFNASGAVERVPLAGGAVVTIATGMSSSNLVTDGTSVYFGSGTAVVKVPTGGGPVVTLASESSDPWALALDSKCSYWSDAVNVMRGEK